MFEYQNKKIHNIVLPIDIQSEEHHILTGKKMRDRRMKDRCTLFMCMYYTVVNNCSAEDKSEMDNNSIKQF